MTLKDNTPKPTILVLLDLASDTEKILTTAESMAKKLSGKLKVLHVKEPAKVIKQENQLSAKKELYEDYRLTQQKLEAFLKEVKVSMEYDLMYGNIKINILGKIESSHPDIIVMGKRQKKSTKILGDRLTEAIIDQGMAAVFIVDSKQQTPSAMEYSVGVFSDKDEIELGPWASLMQNNATEVNYFSIESNNDSPRSTSDNRHFVFPNNSNAIKSLATYTTKTNIQLFCFPKGVDKAISKKLVTKLQTHVLYAH